MSSILSGLFGSGSSSGGGTPPSSSGSGSSSGGGTPPSSSSSSSIKIERNEFNTIKNKALGTIADATEKLLQEIDLENNRLNDFEAKITTEVLHIRDLIKSSLSEELKKMHSLEEIFKEIETFNLKFNSEIHANLKKIAYKINNLHRTFNVALSDDRHDISLIDINTIATNILKQETALKSISTKLGTFTTDLETTEKKLIKHLETEPFAESIIKNTIKSSEETISHAKNTHDTLNNLIIKLNSTVANIKSIRVMP